MRFVRITLGIVLGSALGILLFLSCLVLVVNSLNWNKHLSLVASTTEKLTDWKVEGLEALEIHLGRQTAFGVKGMVLRHERDAPLEFVSVEEASLILRPWPFLQNRLVMESIKIRNGRIVLNNTPDKSDDRNDPSFDLNSLDGWPALFIHQASVDDLEIQVHPGNGKEPRHFSVDQLHVQSQDAKSPVKIDSHGRALDMPYKLAGTVGSFQRFQAAWGEYPIDLKLELAHQKLTIDGMVHMGRNSFSFDIGAHGSDYSQVSEIFGGRFHFKDAPPYTVSAQFKGDSKVWTIKNLVLGLGKSQVNGSGRYRFSREVPRIEAELQSSLLRYQDFMAFLPNDKSERKPEAPGQARDWGDFDELIPVAFLKSHEGRIHLSLDEVRGRRNHVLLSSLNANVSLQKGVLTVDPLTVSLKGKELKASLIVENQTRTIQMTLTRPGKAFNFIQTVRSLLDKPQPWPLSYFTAQHLTMNLRWLESDPRSPLAVNFKIADGRVHFKKTANVRNKRDDVGFQKQLAAYPPIIVESGHIGRMHWTYLKNGRDLTGYIETMNLASMATDQPFRLVSQGRVMRLPYQVSARLGSYDELKDSRRSYPLELKGTLGGQQLRLSGGLRPAQNEYKLDVSASGEKLTKLNTILPVSFGPLPPYHLQFSLVYEPDLLNFGNIDIRLGQSTLKGDLAVRLGALKPTLTGQIVAPFLRFDDINGFWESSGKAASTRNRRQSTPLSNEVLPFHLLHRAQADLSVQIEKYEGPMAGKLLSQAEVRVRLSNGRLMLEPFNVASSLGQMGGILTVDARRKPAQLSADLGLEVKNMTGMARKFSLAFPRVHLSPRELVKGKLIGTVEFKSQGSSLRQLVANSDGQMQFVIEQGYLAATVLEALSMDITETIATLITDHPATPINCMYANFRLDNGVIRSDQFFLSTRDSNVRASGYLDLNKQFIDYRVEASAKDFSIGSVGSPVYLTGPLDDIRIRTSRREIVLRTAASIALGTLINPILALVPFVEPGLEKEGQCTRYADRVVRLQYQADDKISSR